jgi:hypothetical protein
MMPFASPYGSPLYWSFHERPEAWHIDPFHQYAKQLVFFGGGRFTHSTHFHDSSLYGNHGALTNMDPATDWVRELGRWATDHDGTNDRVVCPVLPFLTAFSLSCWMKFSGNADATRYEHLISRGGVFTNDTNYAFFVRCTSVTTSRDWGVICRSGSTLSEVFYRPSGTADPYYALDRDWHHLAMTWTGAVAAIFFDGIPITPTTNTFGGGADGGQATWIGDGVDATDYPFTGKIADPMIWSRVLSPSEISALADPGNVMLSLGGSDPGLIVPDDLVYPVYLPSSVVAGAKPALWLGVCV